MLVNKDYHVFLYSLQRLGMTSRFNAVVVTSLVVLQVVAGRYLEIRGRIDGSAAEPGVLYLLPSSLSSATVKRRSSVVARIQRLWLSRSSTSDLVNDQLHQLLDWTADVDLLSKDIDQLVDGWRSMRYGR